MDTLDTVVKVILAAGSVLSVILGAKFIQAGAEKRKLDAEGRGQDVNAAKVVSDTAILWMDRWEEQLEVWQDYAYTLESSIEEWAELFRDLKRMIEESGTQIVLPPPPPRPRRPKPPRHKPEG